MELGHRSACLVEVTAAPSWNPLKRKKKVEASCSGILINRSTGHVLTHASLLMPYLSSNKKLLKRLCKSGYLSEKDLDTLQVSVTIGSIASNSKEQHKGIQDKHAYGLLHNFTAIFNVSSRSYSSSSDIIKGQIQLVWKAKHLAKALKSLFPTSDRWKFYEDPVTETEGTTDEKSSTANFDPELIPMTMPFFVLVKLVDWLPSDLNMTASIRRSVLRQGEECVVVGTPFGNLSPAVFLNSLSKGVICNVAGEEKELLLTDARCIPGTEGAPLLTKGGLGRVELAGMVIAPLCWKANEWMGLSIACSLHEIISALAETLQTGRVKSSVDCDSLESIVSTRSGAAAGNGLLVNQVPVVLIWNKGTWGSGIIMDQNEGLIVTCSHVVLDQTKVQVGVGHPLRTWFEAEVLFATPSNHVWDVAVLKMRGYVPRPQWPQTTPVEWFVEEGQDVAMIGHAMFSREHNLRPSITCGTVSKVSTVQGSPVCIQSSCTVTAGASGGPLVTKAGNIVGVVACNARDTTSGASFPNINLAVPMSAIWTVVQQYLETGDASQLQALHLYNKEVKSLWNLQDIQRIPDGSIQSKL